MSLEDTRAAALLGLALLLGGAPAGASISGICPDGSMFVVKKAEDIPCSDAKQVEASRLPPIRPHYLPRPYAWEAFQRSQDPNNPYNVIDEPPDTAPETPTPAPPVAPPPPESAGTPAPVASPPPPRVLALDAQETRDLALIVELTQQRAPAHFERGEGGTAHLRVALARSRAFEARLHAHHDDAVLGPVVLFVARAEAAETFHANFTFVQGHAAFHVDRGDPRQFGVLAGSLGALAPGEEVLGYVVLPVELDPAAPVDVYWNDRLISAVFSPE